MIGQSNNLYTVSRWQQHNLFPRFLIITGERGSGKKTMAAYIAKQIGGYIVNGANKVDDIREIIENSYKCTSPTVYIFSDADKMSPQAKNSLLKVTEDPPRKAYFIMTVEDVQNTLVTLKSRATCMSMEAYSPQHIRLITDNELICKIAVNPGQALELQNLNVDEFYAFCNTVIDNVGQVTGVNAFKLATRLKYKDDGEGYDPVLFLNTIAAICRERILGMKPRDPELGNRYVRTLWTCSEYKNQLKITGIKKDATMDMWVLDMREIWKES